MSSELVTCLVQSLSPVWPSVFATYGVGGDVDVAFDEATALAGNEHGFTGAHPSVAVADAGAVELVPGEAVPLAATVLRAGDDLAGPEAPAAGVVRAYPVAANSSVSRRRVRLVLEDVGLDAPGKGPVGVLTGGLREAIVAGLVEQGQGLADGEFLEQVTVVRTAARYKPVVQVNKGKMTSVYAVLDPATSTVLETGLPTAGAARRAAVVLAKEGAWDGAAAQGPEADLHVVRVSTREGLPYVRITRTRTVQKVVVRVVVAKVKDPAKTRTVGWLFTGTDPVEPEPATGLEEAPDA